MFPKKITIIKVSIMYADFAYIIHQKWPTELGMKKWKRRNFSTPFDLKFSKSGGNFA